ncbi:MAG: chromate efflux transporter [Leptospira sp.]|nr:chromate efflux transporter [Leptospira sp.]
MNYLEIFLTSLRLGLTSFGGPIAHLGYFREEFVIKKKWMTEENYADLVALCQFLPGPASSQVGMGVGLSRGGIFGAILAWVGFTLPSSIVLILFGLGVTQLDMSEHNHWLHALKVVAVAVVAQAVLGMGKKLCPDKERITLAVLSALVVLLIPTAWVQVLVMLVAGIVGVFFLKGESSLPGDSMHRGSRTWGTVFLIAFVGFLFGLPILREVFSGQTIQIIDSFYRSGSLVFGGGHVVLPLLQSEVVPVGWVSNDLFLAGYGVANAVPGPLFTFSAYLGTVSSAEPNGWLGGMLALVAIFLPSFLLIIGILPFWENLRSIPSVRYAMLGLNAGVVGILLAALYNPVWTSAILSPRDFATAAVGFVLLEYWKLPSWAVVGLTLVVSFV